MAYVVHSRLTWSGTLGTDSPPPEAFSFGLNMSNSTAMTDGEEDSYFEAAVALFEDSLSGIHSCAHLRLLKAASINTSNKYVGNALTKTGNVAGAGSGEPPPFQAALVVSLTTGVRGPSRRGRIYLPVPNFAVQSEDGLISPTSQANAESAVGTFLNAVCAVRDDEIVVVSSKGYNTVVTGFRVGRVIDTLRSRRRSLDESYGDPVALAG